MDVVLSRPLYDASAVTTAAGLEELQLVYGVDGQQLIDACCSDGS